MKKNELIKTQEKIYRVLDVSENENLIIDCLKLTMPQWVEAESILDAETITDEELCSITDCHAFQNVLLFFRSGKLSRSFFFHDK